MDDISHQTSRAQVTNCALAMMQLCFARRHWTFQSKSVTDDTLRFLAKAAMLKMLQHKKGCEYLCQKLGMMSCRHVLLAFLHASLKLDVLLLQRLLGVGQT